MNKKLKSVSNMKKLGIIIIIGIAAMLLSGCSGYYTEVDISGYDGDLQMDIFERRFGPGDKYVTSVEVEREEWEKMTPEQLDSTVCVMQDEADKLIEMLEFAKCVKCE